MARNGWRAEAGRALKAVAVYGLNMLPEVVVSDAQYYQGLAKSMMSTIILVSFAPLLTITLVAGYQYNIAYEEKVGAHLRELVLKHDQTVDTYLEDKIEDLKALAEVAGLERLRDQEGITGLHTILMRTHGPDYVDLGLIDSRGVQISYAGPYDLRGAEYGDAQWVRMVRERKVYISDVFAGQRGVPHFVIALLVEQDGEEWVLRTTLDFAGFNELVGSVRMAETGHAYIINREGAFQTATHSDLAEETDFLRQLAASSEGKDAPASFASLVSPVTGRETLFVTSPLKRGEWLLVFQQDAADAYSQLDHARTLVVAVLLFGGLAIAVMAFLMSRRMARKVKVADDEKEMLNEQVIEAGKLASVGELAAGIAHEINNPVAIMVEEAGWVQDLLVEGLDVDNNSQEVQRALNQIRSQGIRCKDITHKLLSFARNTDPATEHICLNAMIREMAEFCEHRAKYANVHFEMNLADTVAQVDGSPSEMQQVLLNLINNAMDAMEPDGGNLTIETRMQNDRVVCSIADTGCGIPKNTLSRIFDPFFTTKPEGKGTGLGLSIIYSIINKMGGEISVRSVVDMGTTFILKLPPIEPTVKEGASCRM